MKRSWLATVALLAQSAIFSANASAQHGPPATPVGVDEVRAERVQARQMVTGELRAVHRSRVASEESGVVSEMRVVEGQHVKAGDVLAVLDQKRMELELAQTVADQAVARALVTERQADLQQAKDDAEALRAVFQQRAANAKELRDAESAQRIAEARLVWAERGADVVDARRRLIEQRLADMTIKAPYDGVVIARHVEVGEWLAEGDGVVDLVSVGAIEAWLNVPQSLFAGSSEPGLDVTINVEASGEMLSSVYKRVIPQVDARARTFTLVATYPNADRRLASGMSVVGWVPMGAAEERLTVPSDAILRNETGPYVYVVRPAKEGPPQAMLVKVKVLYPQGARRVIEAAELGAGDMVVTEGNERLFPFAPVQPIEKPVVSRSEAKAGALE